MAEQIKPLSVMLASQTGTHLCSSCSASNPAPSEWPRKAKGGSSSQIIAIPVGETNKVPTSRLQPKYINIGSDSEHERSLSLFPFLSLPAIFSNK